MGLWPHINKEAHWGARDTPPTMTCAIVAGYIPRPHKLSVAPSFFLVEMFKHTKIRPIKTAERHMIYELINEQRNYTVHICNAQGGEDQPSTNNTINPY